MQKKYLLKLSLFISCYVAMQFGILCLICLIKLTVSQAITLKHLTQVFNNLKQSNSVHSGYEWSRCQIGAHAVNNKLPFPSHPSHNYHHFQLLSFSFLAETSCFNGLKSKYSEYTFDSYKVIYSKSHACLLLLCCIVCFRGLHIKWTGCPAVCLAYSGPSGQKLYDHG